MTIDDIKIFACQPSYASGKPASHRQFYQGIIKSGSKYRGKVTQTTGGFSLLSCMFNRLWVHALNMQSKTPFTHFAMLHDDVVPEDGWLDILMEELLVHKADIVSAVIPLKSPLGFTSTAIDNPENEFSIKRYITMNEVHQLPETFSAADCGSDEMLLVNTGCWVCDFTKDWRFQVCFRVKDRIVRTEDGSWSSEFVPEDWDFSRQVQRLGGKVLCTRKVKLDHYGEMPFSNKEPWGLVAQQ